MNGDGDFGVPKRNGDVHLLEQNKGTTGVQKWRREMVGAARELHRKVAAGGEEDDDALLDSLLPATIPWTRRERTTRRSSWWSSICSRRSLSTAALDGELG